MATSLPNLGMWRVVRTVNTGQEVGTRPELRNYIGSLGKSIKVLPVMEGDAVRLPDDKRGGAPLEGDNVRLFTSIAAYYGVLDPTSTAHALSGENKGGKGVLNLLESTAIMEAERHVFDECRQDWANSEDVRLCMPRRPPSHRPDNDFDYYIDVYPIDVKTASAVYSNTSLGQKLLIKQRLIEVNPQSRFAAKREKIGEAVAAMEKKDLKKFSKDLPASLDDLSDGLYGTVNAVVAKIRSGGLLLYAYFKEIGQVGGINHIGVAKRLGVTVEELPTVRVIPYIVLDTGFLTDKHRNKLWTLLSNKLNGIELRHVIEVHSCTHDHVLQGMGYNIGYKKL